MAKLKSISNLARRGHPRPDFRPFEDFPCINVKSIRELQQLGISDPPNLGFDLRQRLATDVPAAKIEFCDKHGLSEVLALPQITDDRPNNVSWSFHVRNSELDYPRFPHFNGSEFGTIQKNAVKFKVDNFA